MKTSKLTFTDAEYIRYCLKTEGCPMTKKQLAEQFGVSTKVINNILNNRTFKRNEDGTSASKNKFGVSRNVGEQHPGAILSENDAMIVKQMHAAGADRVDLAEQFHVAVSTISSVINGSRWKHLSSK